MSNGLTNGHMLPEDVTPEQLTLIRENWSRANEELDHLIELTRVHRTPGTCGDAGWCIGEHAIHELGHWGADVNNVQALLNAALTRLADPS